MPTTMEPTKIDQLPTVTSDQNPSVINATVTISLGDAPGTYRCDVPPLSAAGRNGLPWTVIWTLVTTSPHLSATFKDSGIIIPVIPGGIGNPQSMGISPLPGSNPTMWQLNFTNNVLDVNVIRYKLDLDVKDTTMGESLKRSTSIIVDPTIAVVKEPIDG